MADEGASSSSNSIDDVDEGPACKIPAYSTNFASHCVADNSCTTVSSSGHMASSSQGIVELSRLTSNPFAITTSIADSTENKGDGRPIVAPPILKLDNSGVDNTAPTIVLRPSALAVQAEKLKLMNKHESNPKQEGKENSSDESNVVKEARFIVSESNGKVSKSERFACGISTSSDITVSSSSKMHASENNNSFSLAATRPDELSSYGGFIFGRNVRSRVLKYESSRDRPASPDTHNLTFEEPVLKKEDLEKMEQQSKEAPTIVLRPSALAVQAEKLKLMNKHETSPKQEDKEISDENNVLKEARFIVCESNGKVSKSERFACGISTSSDITVSSSSKTHTSESNNSFSLAAAKPDELSSKGGFVFGQNLHERALNYDSSSDRPASPDTHNLTFEEAALKKEELEKMEQRNQEEKMKKSLTESAKEYESRQVKRKFDEVTVITGEEEESNVLQINCKLFAFDKVNMNWQERGRGILRLNDREHNGILHSRVVMRIQGSLRVVLNTKVWAGMSVEHPSQKSVRLTAFDPQGVKVFLVMAQPKDAEQLFDALNWRVTTLRATDSRIDDDNSCSTVEEATSSSTLPDNSSSPRKQSRLSDSCNADSSTEVHFTSQDTLTSESGGCADSTDVQS